jgi:hypothetical protein
LSAKRDIAWFKAVAERVNGDPEMAAIGRHFTATIAFTMDDVRHDMIVEKGKVVEIRDIFRIDSQIDFGLRAPNEVWDTFLQKYPPPLYHNVFAMIMRVPAFRLEGDTLVFAQNARAITRLLSIMQTQGAQ